MSHHRILIVDDDALFVESNKDLLEAYGYEVQTALDGMAGMEIARQFKPHVIILDLMMASDTEGFEVARKIMNSPELKDTKMLLVTGVAHALNISSPLKPDKVWLPVDRVLEKPITPGRLLAEVGKILRRKNKEGS